MSSKGQGNSMTGEKTVTDLSKATDLADTFSNLLKKTNNGSSTNDTFPKDISTNTIVVTDLLCSHRCLSQPLVRIRKPQCLVKHSDFFKYLREFFYLLFCLCSGRKKYSAKGTSTRPSDTRENSNTMRCKCRYFPQYKDVPQT